MGAARLPREIVVTRLIGPSELFHPDFVSHKWQRRIRWMFWGRINGIYGKGYGIFWKKEWKTIIEESYPKHIIPPLSAYFYTHPWLLFQQGGGPGNTAAFTLDALAAYGIQPVF